MVATHVLLISDPADGPSGIFITWDLFDMGVQIIVAILQNQELAITEFAFPTASLSSKKM
jgi:hypothetical protein